LIDDVAAMIAGEIVLSDNPGKIMRKWREYFGVSQSDLAIRLGTSSSVISDYESGRRRSPGSQFIKKLVRALVSIELERGGSRLQLLGERLSGIHYWDAIIDMRDFEKPISLVDMVNSIGGIFVVKPEGYGDVHGYTIVDSLKLVLDVPPHEYLKLYGTTTQRAAVFSNVRYGRSPLIAIKSMMAFIPVRPSIVVLHGIERPDYLGIEIARREKIPLAVVNAPLEEIIGRLRGIAEKQRG